MPISSYTLQLILIVFYIFFMILFSYVIILMIKALKKYLREDKK